MGLKGIPTIISPDLLKVLAEMGHGDMIVLADAYFPGPSIAKSSNARIIRADGVASIPRLLEAILTLIDIDSYTDTPITLMDLTAGDKQKNMNAPNWPLYASLMHKNGVVRDVHLVERTDFYKMAKSTYCIVMTGDTSIYGNIILVKGVTKGVNW